MKKDLNIGVGYLYSFKGPMEVPKCDFYGGVMLKVGYQTNDELKISTRFNHVASKPTFR